MCNKIITIIITFFSISCIAQKEVLKDASIYRIYNCDSEYTEFEDLYDNLTGELLGKDSCDCKRTDTDIPNGTFLFHAKDSVLVWKIIKVDNTPIHSARYYCDGSLKIEYENINGITLRKVYNYGVIESIDHFYKSENCGVSQFFDKEGKLIKVVIHEKCG